MAASSDVRANRIRRRHHSIRSSNGSRFCLFTVERSQILTTRRCILQPWFVVPYETECTVYNYERISADAARPADGAKELTPATWTAEEAARVPRGAIPGGRAVIVTTRCVGSDGVGWSLCRVPRESEGLPSPWHFLESAPEATGWVRSKDLAKAEVYVCKQVPSCGTLSYLKAQHNARGTVEYVPEERPIETQVRKGDLVFGVEVRKIGNEQPSAGGGNKAYLRLAAALICKHGELFLALADDSSVWLEKVQHEQTSQNRTKEALVHTPDMFPHLASVGMSLSLIQNLHSVAPGLVGDVCSNLLGTVLQIKPVNCFREATNAPLVLAVTNQILEFVLRHMLGADSSYSTQHRVTGIELALALCLSTGDSVNLLRLVVVYLRMFYGVDQIQKNRQELCMKRLDELLQNVPAPPASSSLSPSNTNPASSSLNAVANNSPVEREDAAASQSKALDKANALLGVVTS